MEFSELNWGQKLNRNGSITNNAIAEASRRVVTIINPGRPPSRRTELTACQVKVLGPYAIQTLEDGKAAIRTYHIGLGEVIQINAPAFFGTISVLHDTAPE